MLSPSGSSWTVLALSGLLTIHCQEVRAELRFSSPAVHLGEVRSGVPLARRFMFVNTGPGTAELTEVRPSCGCLTPQLERRVWQPGEEGSLVLEANTLGQSAGDHTWRVQVQYRQGGELQELMLEVAAKIVTEVTVQPAALTLFAEGALRQDVVLTDLRPQPLSLTELRTSSPHLRATPQERSRDDLGNWVVRIKLEASADFPEGRHEEVLNLYTNDPLYGHLKVPVTVVRRIRQRIMVTPGQVEVRTATTSTLLRVRDSGNETVVVESVTADDPAIQCRWAPGPDNLATVRVQVDRTKLRGDNPRSAVHIHVASPLRETVTVPVLCTAE